MVNLFGATWTKSYGLADRDGQWLKTLGDLTPDQLAYGIEKVRHSGKTFPPSAPELKALCLPAPEDLGLPSVIDAWTEVNDHAHEPDKHPWSHRAVYLAGRYTQWFHIRAATKAYEQKTVLELFQKHYCDMCLRVQKGQPLEPVKLLENQRNAEAEAEKGVQKAMAEQGINPNGGRAEFKKRLKGLLL